MKITSFKRSQAHTATLGASNPAAGHHQPTPLPETPGPSRASLGQSLVGSLLLSPGSWCIQGSVCALQESVSPVLCKFWWRCGSMVACCRVGRTECSSVCMGFFEGRPHYLHCLYHSLASVKDDFYFSALSYPFSKTRIMEIYII